MEGEGLSNLARDARCLTQRKRIAENVGLLDKESSLWLEKVLAFEFDVLVYNRLMHVPRLVGSTTNESGHIPNLPKNLLLAHATKIMK
jgi:hypothetical protein